MRHGRALSLALPLLLSLPFLVRCSTAVRDVDGEALVRLLAAHSVVVTFYSRWCALCAALEPELVRVAHAFNGLTEANGFPLVFARCAGVRFDVARRCCNA